MKMATRKKYNLSQAPPNAGFMQEKVQKGDFLKKGLARIIFLSFLSYVSMNLPKAWNAKLGAGSFCAI